jgi:hypothetical protein
VRDTRWITVVVAIALIVAVGLIVRSLLFPGFRTPPSYPTPTPTPAGAEYARASAFWNNTEVPAVAAVIKSVPAITKNCKGRLSAACQTAIVATDQKLQYAITVINTGDIPACLTTHVTRFKSDLLAMDGGLQVALNGYRAGDQQQVDQGLALFQENSLPLTEDAAAVSNDLKVLCN